VASVTPLFDNIRSTSLQLTIVFILGYFALPMYWLVDLGTLFCCCTVTKQ